MRHKFDLVERALKIASMARGGHVLEDDYPTHYLPHVGRQVMADGGMLDDLPTSFAPLPNLASAPRKPSVPSAEGRVIKPAPVEEAPVDEGVEAYHGSPHEFEEFDPAKIGTGEGAQVYGHGLYFAGNENVAKYYRDSLTDPDNVPLHFKGRPVDTVWNDEISNRWHDVVKKLPKDHVNDFQTVMGSLSQINNLADLKHVQANLDRKQKNILNKVVLPELYKPETGSGHMYEVRLDAHPEEHLLDWDKPLKDQHPNVIAAFNKAVVPVKDDEDKMIHEMYGDKAAHEYLGLFDKSKGSQAYKTFAKQIGGQDKASEALSKAGIRGIRYLDAGSRGQDETSGSHNYVIFDPQHIKVKRRYAEGGEVPEDKDEGIVAYAFGNSIPHIEERIAKGEFPEIEGDKPNLAQGVEPVSKEPPTKSYGGGVPSYIPEERVEDLARRLITFSYAVAPLVPRVKGAYAEGGSVDDPIASAVDTARNLNPMGFYSAAAEAASKFPQKAPIDQIVNKIKGQPNVKKEELDNANLADAFAGQRSVDPQEVARHLQASVPQISETIYGQYKYKPQKMSIPSFNKFDDAEEVHRLHGPSDRADMFVGTHETSGEPEYIVYDASGRPHSTHEDFDEAVATANEHLGAKSQPAQYSEYTIPGGENYREVVMHLPPSKGSEFDPSKLKINRTRRSYTQGNAELIYDGTPIGNFEDKIELNPETGNYEVAPDDYWHDVMRRRWGGSQDLNIKSMDKGQNYRSSHWSGVTNPIAHLRMSDRDDGKTLHLEELQSDWGQEAQKIRKQEIKRIVKEKGIDKKEASKLVSSDFGFKDPNEKKADSLLDQMIQDFSFKLPRAPYVTDTGQWVDLGLKRALMEAAKGGYDKLIWTPGEDQANRYNLRKHVEALSYDPEDKVLSFLPHGGNRGRGYINIPGKIEPHEIEEHIGKEAAERLLAAEPNKLSGNHNLSGEDLEVGGEGMQAFYDKLVPQRLSKLIAQYDPEAKVKLHSHKVTIPGETGQKLTALRTIDPTNSSGYEDKDVMTHAIQITPKLREAILKGLPAFKSGGDVGYDRGGSIIRRALDVISKLPQ